MHISHKVCRWLECYCPCWVNFIGANCIIEGWLNSQIHLLVEKTPYFPPARLSRGVMSTLTCPCPWPWFWKFLVTWVIIGLRLVMCPWDILFLKSIVLNRKSAIVLVISFVLSLNCCIMASESRGLDEKFGSVDGLGLPPSISKVSQELVQDLFQDFCISSKLLKDIFLAKLPLLIDLIGLDLFTCKVRVFSSSLSLLVLALLLQFPDFK